MYILAHAFRFVTYMDSFVYNESYATVNEILYWRIRDFFFFLLNNSCIPNSYVIHVKHRLHNRSALLLNHTFKSTLNLVMHLSMMSGNEKKSRNKVSESESESEKIITGKLFSESKREFSDG